MFVDQARHQFFTAARFAADVHRRLTAGQFENLFAQRLHGRKDSFYHLHANIARKDAEKKALVSRIRAEKLEKSRNMQAEAQALGLDEYDRWRQQLEYNDDDFSRAFVE